MTAWDVWLFVLLFIAGFVSYAVWRTFRDRGRD